MDRIGHGTITMIDEAKFTEQFIEKMEFLAGRKAMERAQAAKWDIDVAAFYFAILVLVVILVYQSIRIEIVAASAITGVIMGWLMGWIKGKQKYRRFYNEELLKVELELRNAANRIMNVTPDEQTLKKRRKKSRKKNVGNNVS